MCLLLRGLWWQFAAPGESIECHSCTSINVTIQQDVSRLDVIMKVASRMYILNCIENCLRRILHLLECQILHGWTLHHSLQRGHIHQGSDLIYKITVIKVLDKLSHASQLRFLQLSPHLKLYELAFWVALLLKFAEDFDGHCLPSYFMPTSNYRWGQILAINYWLRV